MKPVVIFLSLCLLGNFSCQGQPKAPDQATQGYLIGSKVKDFKMKNVDGEIHSLASIEKAKG